MDDLIAKVESKYLKEEIPQIEPGDTVRVRLQVTEGEGDEQSTRTHSFQGTVIARGGSGLNRTITVRRVTYGIGVERTFPLHSPTVLDVEVVRRGATRRAKLYYLRDRHERAARLKERKPRVEPAVAPEAEAEEPAEVEPEAIEPEAEEAVEEVAAEPAEQLGDEAEDEAAVEPTQELEVEMDGEVATEADDEASGQEQAEVSSEAEEDAEAEPAEEPEADDEE